MNFFNTIFKRKSKELIPPSPSWETVVEMMYDKQLNVFSGEVVRVIYSKERTMMVYFYYRKMYDILFQ